MSVVASRGSHKLYNGDPKFAYPAKRHKKVVFWNKKGEIIVINERGRHSLGIAFSLN